MIRARHLAATFSVALFSLFAVTACGPDDGRPPVPPHEKLSSPIIGGATDGGDPAVVLVAYTNFLCTGTVIAPRVVLTAGHCTVVNDNCVSPNCSALSPSGYQIAGGTDPFNGADWVIGVSEVHPNPGYDGSQLLHDMGILILKQDAPVSPLSWEDTNTPYNAGQNFKGVGYGLANAPSGPDTSGVKRSVSLNIQQTFADAFAYGSASANTCEGDSGGPALVGSKVIGTVSYGDQNCAQYGVDMRTDYEKTFISQYASPNGTGAGGGGKKHSICSVGGEVETSGRGFFPMALLIGAFGAVVASRRRARRV